MGCLLAVRELESRASCCSFGEEVGQMYQDQSEISTEYPET